MRLTHENEKDKEAAPGSKLFAPYYTSHDFRDKTCRKRNALYTSFKSHICNKNPLDYTFSNVT